MPVTEDINIPASASYVPVPADMYQFVIKDIESEVQPKYMGKEGETQLQFKIVTQIVGDDTLPDHKFSLWASAKWFAGKKGLQPSKLFNVFKAIYDFYYPQVNLREWKLDMINKAAINDLIGKQLRMTLSEEDGKNKPTAFMAIKKELEVPVDADDGFPEEKKAKKAKDEPAGEKVEPDDIPF